MSLIFSWIFIDQFNTFLFLRFFWICAVKTKPNTNTPSPTSRRNKQTSAADLHIKMRWKRNGVEILQSDQMREKNVLKQNDLFGKILMSKHQSLWANFLSIFRLFSPVFPHSTHRFTHIFCVQSSPHKYGWATVKKLFMLVRFDESKAQWIESNRGHEKKENIKSFSKQIKCKKSERVNGQTSELLTESETLNYNFSWNDKVTFRLQSLFSLLFHFHFPLHHFPPSSVMMMCIVHVHDAVQF